MGEAHETDPRSWVDAWRRGAKGEKRCRGGRKAGWQGSGQTVSNGIPRSTQKPTAGSDRFATGERSEGKGGTHLDEVHVRHDGLDLPNDLGLGRRVELLELDGKDGLLLRGGLEEGQAIVSSQKHNANDGETERRARTGRPMERRTSGSAASAAAAPPAAAAGAAEAAGMAISVMLSFSCCGPKRRERSTSEQKQVVVRQLRTGGGGRRVDFSRGNSSNRRVRLLAANTQGDEP